MSLHYVVFGSRGMIGSALVRKLMAEAPGANMIRPERQDVMQPDLPPFLSSLDGRECVVFYCHGPTDPKLDFQIHQQFHVDLPSKWFDWFSKNTRLVSFITLGSVHENETRLHAGNNYLRAKRLWKERHPLLGGCSIHLQLHTIYGTPLRPHSFLGQMFHSLKSRSEFKMSHGNQLREYHHAADLAETLISIGKTDSKSNIRGQNIALSHGHPLSLKDLAQSIFKHFDLTNLLQIGAISAPSGEISVMPDALKPGLIVPKHRPSLTGIIELFEQQGIQPRSNAR